MASAYLDSSALVKYYHPEAGSEAVLQSHTAVDDLCCGSFS